MLLEVTKIYNSRDIFIFLPLLRGGGGGEVVFVVLLTYINVKFRVRSR